MGVISNGTTLLDAGALDGGIATGNMTLLSTLTASSSATIDFTSGISSTYKEYVFKFIDIHPSAGANFNFQGNAAGGSGFNEAMTTTFFYAYHKEDGSDPTLMYNTGRDQAQGTGYQSISADGTGTDAEVSGAARSGVPTGRSPPSPPPKDPLTASIA